MSKTDKASNLIKDRFSKIDGGQYRRILIEPSEIELTARL